MNNRTIELQTVQASIRSGAVYGAISWTVYGIVEFFFSIFLPWIMDPSYDYVPLHWGFTVLLGVIYPLTGLTLGSLCGFLFITAARRYHFVRQLDPLSFFPVVAVFSVILAFDLNLTIDGIRSIKPAEWPSLLFSFLLFLGVALSNISVDLFKRLRFLMNPWTVSIILLGLPWINKEILFRYSIPTIIGGTVAFTLTILSLSLIIQKTREKRHVKMSFPAYPTKRLISLILVMLLFSGIGYFLKQSPLREDLNLETEILDGNRNNVILVVLDTVRADHLSLYGYGRNTTTNINRFAEEATFYSHSIASGDFTLSTHASIFTGLYARQHGAHSKRDLMWRCMPLASKFHTLAEMLSEKGYLTIGVSSNTGFVSHHYNMDQGFEHFDSRSPVHFFMRADEFYIRQFVRNILSHFALNCDYEKGYRKAEDINEEVFALLDKVRNIRKPFFLFINYMDAHHPYLPVAPYDTVYPGKIDAFNSAWYSKTFGEIMTLKREITEKEKNHLISQYDGEIAYLDFHVGELMARLKEQRLYEDSLIIITSDHGEAFGERNFMQHGFSVYQDQVYVPLIIKYPDIKKAHVIDELVNSVDLMPTVLDVLGYEIPVDIQGQSLLKLENMNKRPIISESFPGTFVIRWHERFDRFEKAIFLDGLKFIHSTAGKRELYDLSKDPDEEENLYSQTDNRAKKLETALNEWLKKTMSEAELAAPVELKKDALRRLRELGYIK